MYYPKSQIIENLKANPGDGLVNPDTGQEYEGSYYKTSDGKFYTGKNPQDPPNRKLIQSAPVDKSKDSEPLPESYYIIDDAYFASIGRGVNTPSPRPPKSSYPKPTESDYKLGEFQRYFLYNITKKEYLEVNKKEFNLFKSKNNQVQWQYYQSLQLNWNLTGIKEDVYIVNRRIVDLVEFRNNAQGFTNYFKNKFDQYFKFAAANNLETKGGEFIVRKTGKEYVGPYHVHPDKGPMVGAKHVLTPHDLLVPISGSMERINQVIRENTNPTTTSGGSSGGY